MPDLGETVSDTLDLTKASSEDRIEIAEVSPYSPEWAKTVKPVALILLGLIALVMLLPFLIIVMAEENKARQRPRLGKDCPPAVWSDSAVLSSVTTLVRAVPSRAPHPRSNSKGTVLCFVIAPFHALIRQIPSKLPLLRKQLYRAVGSGNPPDQNRASFNRQ